VKKIFLIISILLSVTPCRAADFRIALISDIHNGDDETSGSPYFIGYRTQSVSWLGSFTTRMATFNPSLIGSLGDMSTATSSSNKTSLLTAVEGALDDSDDSDTDVFFALGNHDFEYASLAEVLTALSDYTYWETGKGYGSFDKGDFHIVILDTNYADSTPYAHFNANGGSIGAHGYIPDGTDGSDDQLGWLEDDLAATSKNTLVFCHASLEEYDGSTFYSSPSSDFSRYSVTNRAAVRSVLEKSGKVAAVFEGHQHFARHTNIKGIPYIQIPSFTLWGVYPNRLLPDNDQGQWAEITIDDINHEIQIDYYEDDSVSGPQIASTCKEYWGTLTPYKNNYGAGIGSASTGGTDYCGGSLTEWTVVTDTANYAPVDFIVAMGNPSEPSVSDSCLVFKGGATSKAGSATRRFSSQAGRFKCHFWIEKEETDKSVGIKLTDSSGTIGPYILFNASGNMVYNDGSPHTIQAYMADTGYDVLVDIDVATDTFTVSVNHGTPSSAYPFANTLTSISRMTVERPASQDFTVYMDDIYFDYNPACWFGCSGTASWQ